MQIHPFEAFSTTFRCIFVNGWNEEVGASLLIKGEYQLWKYIDEINLSRKYLDCLWSYHVFRRIISLSLILTVNVSWWLRNLHELVKDETMKLLTWWMEWKVHLFPVNFDKSQSLLGSIFDSSFWILEWAPFHFVCMWWNFKTRETLTNVFISELVLRWFFGSDVLINDYWPSSEGFLKIV